MMSQPFVRGNLVLGGLLVASSLLVAQQPPAKPEPLSPVPKAEAPKPADAKQDAKQDPFEKRITFTFDNKSWSDVIAWLADQMELPFTGITKPAGSFTFRPPVRAAQPAPTYTIPEILDILNEALQDQHFLLIRREASFTIVQVQDDGKLNMINLHSNNMPWNIPFLFV